MDISLLEEKVRSLRRMAIESLYQAQSGHPGSSMSVMDVLVALYYGNILKHDPKEPESAERDFFLMSNGHACPTLYTVLADRGYFPKDHLKKLRQLDSPLQGHPHYGGLPGIEISSGSLGQGLSVGIGLSYGLRLQKKPNCVYVMMSDGEQEEGSTWEAIMSAAKFKPNNLIAIIDKNQFQIDGATRDVMPSLDPLVDKYEAFGWHVHEVNGHSLEEIISGLRAVKQAASKHGKPAALISHTVRGKGVSFMESSDHWHAGAISKEQFEQAIKELS